MARSMVHRKSKSETGKMGGRKEADLSDTWWVLMP
jgi:hypothetical protein